MLICAYAVFPLCQEKTPNFTALLQRGQRPITKGLSKSRPIGWKTTCPAILHQSPLGITRKQSTSCPASVVAVPSRHVSRDKTQDNQQKAGSSRNTKDVAEMKKGILDKSPKYNSKLAFSCHPHPDPFLDLEFCVCRSSREIGAHSKYRFQMSRKQISS